MKQRDLLKGIPRQPQRQRLGIAQSQLPFTGSDLWQAWELSWLTPNRCPEVAIARFTFPCESPNLIESKSCKLYCHSFNMRSYETVEVVRSQLIQDLSHVADAQVNVELFAPHQATADFNLAQVEGKLLDTLTPATVDYQTPPQPSQLEVGNEEVAETLHSHLLSSRCPITGQPDWGHFSLQYQGKAIRRPTLLAYVLSYRQHQAFHEHCAEQMFLDIQTACNPQTMTLSLRYLRRGGIDISCHRSTSTTPITIPSGRLWRQ